MKPLRASALQLVPLPDLPWIDAGADLAALSCESLAQLDLQLQEQDVLIYAQKVVSKAEGRHVDLRTVTASAAARKLALEVGKDPRLIELILRESRRVVRAAPGVLIVEHRLGFVMANAGIDQSNVSHEKGDDRALLLPADPDASASRLRERLGTLTGIRPGVLINDSFGRPWRIGTTGVAIGCAGLPVLVDKRGSCDLTGRVLQATIIAWADEIAAAASLVMGQADEGTPIVLMRGLASPAPLQPAAALVRPATEDLFR